MRNGLDFFPEDCVSFLHNFNQHTRLSFAELKSCNKEQGKQLVTSSHGFEGEIETIKLKVIPILSLYFIFEISLLILLQGPISGTRSLRSPSKSPNYIAFALAETEKMLDEKKITTVKIAIRIITVVTY